MLLTTNAHVEAGTTFEVKPYRHSRFVTVSVGDLSLFFYEDAKLAELRDALDAYLADQAMEAA